MDVRALLPNDDNIITDDIAHIENNPSNSSSNFVDYYYDDELIHESDAYAAVFLNITLIGCVMLAYYIKKNRIYYVPERYVYIYFCLITNV